MGAIGPRQPREILIAREVEAAGSKRPIARFVADLQSFGIGARTAGRPGSVFSFKVKRYGHGLISSRKFWFARLQDC
jgi:hypothetical protein